MFETTAVMVFLVAWLRQYHTDTVWLSGGKMYEYEYVQYEHGIHPIGKLSLIAQFCKVWKLQADNIVTNFASLGSNNTDA